MRWLSHVIIALAIASTLIKLNIINIALICLFALLPDIDKPNSLIGSQFRRLSSWIYENLGHRSATHSLWLNISLSLIFGLSALLGLFSHLLCDMVTPRGVELLWPCKTRFRLLSGLGRHELVIIIIVLTGVVLKHLFAL